MLSIALLWGLEIALLLVRSAELTRRKFVSLAVFTRNAALRLKRHIEHARGFERALDDLAEGDRRAGAGGVDNAADRRIAAA